MTLLVWLSNVLLTIAILVIWLARPLPLPRFPAPPPGWLPGIGPTDQLHYFSGPQRLCVHCGVEVHRRVPNKPCRGPITYPGQISS